MRKPSRPSGSALISKAVTAMCLHEDRLGLEVEKIAGQRDDGGYSALRAIFDGQVGGISVELVEPGARVGQTNAVRLFFAAGHEPGTIVLYLHLQHSIRAVSADSD